MVAVVFVDEGRLVVGLEPGVEPRAVDVQDGQDGAGGQRPGPKVGGGGTSAAARRLDIGTEDGIVEKHYVGCHGRDGLVRKAWRFPLPPLPFLFRTRLGGVRNSGSLRRLCLGRVRGTCGSIRGDGIQRGRGDNRRSMWLDPALPCLGREYSAQR